MYVNKQTLNQVLLSSLVCLHHVTLLFKDISGFDICIKCACDHRLGCDVVGDQGNVTGAAAHSHEQDVPYVNHPEGIQVQRVATVVAFGAVRTIIVAVQTVDPDISWNRIMLMGIRIIGQALAKWELVIS